MGGSWQTRKASADLSIFPASRSGGEEPRSETCKLGSSISQWRTFILVNLAFCGVHALSFPFYFSCLPPFLLSDRHLTGDSHFCLQVGIIPEKQPPTIVVDGCFFELISP